MTTKKKKQHLKMAEIQITFRNVPDISERPTILVSPIAYDLFLKYWDDGKLDYIEQMKAIFLNAKSKVLGIVDIGSGGISAVPVDSRILFGAAIKARASGIILAHNHPSGDVTPSEQDIYLSKRISEGARFLDMKLLDHLVISRNNYTSMTDEGLLF